MKFVGSLFCLLFIIKFYLYFYNGYRELFIFGIIYFRKHCTNNDDNSYMTAISKRNINTVATRTFNL